MRQVHVRRWLPAAALAIAISAPPATARCDSDSDVTVMWLVYTLVPIATVGGLVATIANSVYAGQGRRPHLAWIIVGFAFGALDLGVGSWFLTWQSNDPVRFGAGVPGVALGAAGIALPAIGLSRPRGGQRISLVPRLNLRLEADGRVAPLLSLSLQGI